MQHTEFKREGDSQGVQNIPSKLFHTAGGTLLLPSYFRQDKLLQGGFYSGNPCGKWQPEWVSCVCQTQVPGRGCGYSLGTGLSTSGMRISTRAWYRMWSQLLIHLRMGSYLHRVISLSFGRLPSGSSSLQEEEEGDRVSTRFAFSAFTLPLHF